MTRLISAAECAEGLRMWEPQERGFYAEPSEIGLPTFYEIANQMPALRIPA